MDDISVLIKETPRAGDMAQRLRALAILPEDKKFGSQNPH